MPTVPITIIGTITDGENTKQMTINGLASIPLTDPGYSPPWARPQPPHPDQGLPGGQPYPDHSLPPFPNHPIVIPPTEPPPTQPPPSDSGNWTWAWSPQLGRWVWVKVPGEGEAGPKKNAPTAAKPV